MSLVALLPDILQADEEWIWTTDFVCNTNVYTDDIGQYSSLIYQNGQPAISYYDSTLKNLQFVSYNGSTWTAPITVDVQSSVGKHASLAGSSSSVIGISYYDSVTNNGDLKYAYSQDQGQTWTTATVDGSSFNTGRFTTLAFNSFGQGSGKAGIAYYSDSTYSLLYIASANGLNGWSKPVTVAPGTNAYHAAGQMNSLKFNPSGQPAISYVNHPNANQWTLNYASSPDGGVTWTTTTVDSATNSLGLYNSLAITASGRQGISYWDTYSTNLKFASSSDGGLTWTTQTVDAVGKVGEYTSLAMDDSGRIGISYYDASQAHLKYAWSLDGGLTWSTETVDNGLMTGLYTSLAFDGDLAAISYYDHQYPTLKVATGVFSAMPEPSVWILWGMGVMMMLGWKGCKRLIPEKHLA